MCDLSESDAVDRAAEEILEQIRRGEKPTLEEYVSKYPHIEKQLRDLFPSLLLMDNGRLF